MTPPYTPPFWPNADDPPQDDYRDSGVLTMNDAQLFTHSRAACFRACPRRHELRFEMGLVSDVDDEPRRVGTAFAAAVEAKAKGLDVEAAVGSAIENPFTLAMVASMFAGHEARWAGDELEHVASELEFDLPLVNPATGKSTPTWRLAGKIDRIVRLPDGRLAIMEYKTTSSDFAPGADYWTRLHLDYQLSIYVIAAREAGYDVSTILYDVTRRPALRPSQVPLLDDSGSKIVMCGSERVKTKEGAWRQTGDTAKAYVLLTRPETPEEYATRVSADIREKPDHYFARIEIARIDQDLDDCRAELWAQQRAIREAQNEGRWYRNPESCFGRGYSCDYVGICAMRDLATRTPEGFRRVDNVHTELTGAATVGG